MSSQTVRLFAGLFHYAQKHYERVLWSAEVRMKVDPNVGFFRFSFVAYGLFVVLQDRGLSREAAYNLSLIYMATGANELAKDLYRQWLTL